MLALTKMPINIILYSDKKNIYSLSGYWPSYVLFWHFYASRQTSGPETLMKIKNLISTILIEQPWSRNNLI